MCVIRIVAALALAVVASSAGASLAQQSKGSDPTTREDGAQLFRTWCATCHGLAAQGNGPLAPMLKARVPDLTEIAARNGGLFPTARVTRIVDGRDVVSHGDPEMPIWGNAFKTTRDGYSETAVRARIEAIVRYLEGIQKRNAQ